MGEIVGAALVAHVPTIMLPEEVRLEINEGKEITLVPGPAPHQGREPRPAEARRGDRVRHALGVDVRAHRDGHDRRQGKFTSHELPRGMSRSRTTCPATPSSRDLIAAQAEGRDDCWILANDDPYLPLFYGTVNIWTFLGDPKTAWLSVALNQCCDTDDFLLFGELIGKAIEQSDRRVVLLASGGMTHRFFNFKDLRKRESQKAPDNIYDRAYYDADMGVLEKFGKGDHAGVIDGMPEYRKAYPEGHFGHYLMMAAALGGRACTATGELFSEYEASVGTGQVHVWFERPEGGWTA